MLLLTIITIKILIIIILIIQGRFRPSLNALPNLLSSTLSISSLAFFFFFHPSPCCTVNPTTPPSSPFPLAETEMECVEAALKSNYRKEMTVKLSPQIVMEEFSLQNNTYCDDFFVNDLLDFSNVEEEPEQKEQETPCVPLPQQNDEPSAFKDDYAAVPTSHLSVPAEDEAELEWLSHFVEDSFSEFSAPFPTVVTEKNPTTGHVVAKEQEPEPEIAVFAFKTPVQTKARSKRTRNGVRIWPFSSPSFTESSSSSTTTSSSSSSPSSPLLIYTNFPQSLDHTLSEPKPQKPKKKPSSDNALGPRRCSHCGVQKTPQWRTGPLGPKTLCNACGVRFKSGRLLPEYRPACSPTFSSELHSNHHRKVLEMRRKKEIEPVFAPSPIVPSF